MEIFVDDEAKLTLHGLVQHYVMLHEEEKNRKLQVGHSCCCCGCLLGLVVVVVPCAPVMHTGPSGPA